MGDRGQTIVKIAHHTLVLVALYSTWQCAFDLRTTKREQVEMQNCLHVSILYCYLGYNTPNEFLLCFHVKRRVSVLNCHTF